jgi:two-component system alkaline phosphatase synthesis response regulator PhoP
MKVLLADDDPGMLETLADVLTQAGFDVVSVKDGGEAMAALASDRFDAIILDIVMPGFNGIEVIDETRKSDPAAKFVIITAYSDSELVEEARNRGVDRIFFKPIDIDGLLGTLEEIRRDFVGT